MTRLPEIYFLNLLVATDALRRFLHQNASLKHACHEVDEAKREIHVVFDQHDGDIAAQRPDDLRNHRALRWRQASGGLIEQQHRRVRNKRERNLELALFAGWA